MIDNILTRMGSRVAKFGAAAAGVAGVATAAFSELLRRADRRRASGWEGEMYASPPGGVVMEAVSADGTRLHLVVHGQGDKVVFLVHGWICSTIFYRYQQQYLREGYRVVSLDLRGHGRSAVPSSLEYGVDRLAEDLKAAIDLIGPEQFVIVGHSLGGFTSFRFCARFLEEYRDRLKGVVIVSSSAYPLERSVLFGWLMRRLFPFPLEPMMRIAARFGWLADPMMKLFRRSSLTYMATRVLTFGRKPAGDDVEHVREIIMSTRWASLVMAAKTCMECENVGALPDIDVPVLMQLGDGDLLINIEVNEETLKHLPNARLELYHGAGHCVLLEQHQRVNADMDEFMRHVFAR